MASSSPIMMNYSSFDDVDVVAQQQPKQRRYSSNSNDNNAIDNLNNGISEDPLAAPVQPENKQQQQPEQQNDVLNSHNNTSSTMYRGFSTSIHDMFVSQDMERVDCCAITFCGIFQYDRNRYLLTGIYPPSLLKRCTVHVLLPLTIFITAGVCSIKIRNIVMNEMVAVSLILTIVLYCCIQCYKGGTKRRMVRKNLLYTKYQIQLQQDRNNNSNNNDTAATQVLQGIMMDRGDHSNDDEDDHDDFITKNSDVFFMGQTLRDIRNAHPCCILGCYPDDKLRRQQQQHLLQNNDSSNTDNNYDDIGTYNTNICSYLLNAVLNPICCGAAIQCCGVCGIAQEGREIDRILLPPSYRRIDYITMEPFLFYYPHIYQYKLQQHQLLSLTAATAAATTMNNNDGTITNHTESNPITAITSRTTTATAATRGADPEIGQRAQETESRDNMNRNGKVPKFSFVGIPLSRLSFRLVQTLISVVGITFLWVFVSPYYWKYIIGRADQFVPTFTFIEFIIFLCTFGHAIVFLAIIVYITNHVVRTKVNNSNIAKQVPVHSNLSLDAIIKFFATGFFISASLAFFWEVVAVVVVDTFITILLALSGIEMARQPDSSNKYQNGMYDDDDLTLGQPHTSSSSRSSTIKDTIRAVLRGRIDTRSYHLTSITGRGVQNRPIVFPYFVNPVAEIDGDGGMDANYYADSGSRSSTPEYVDIFGMDHPLLYTLYIAVGAFCVAALIEELCKYFGYRMAEEHPDFLTQDELMKASKIIAFHNDASSRRQRRRQQQSNTNGHGSDDEDDDDDDDDDNNNDDGTMQCPDGTSSSLVCDFSKQLKSVQAHGAAITIAMVATAIGFSCCENLIYIFIYAGGSVSLELGVLIERALFPLHPIVAAIQSIGVCQRDLERSRIHHIGRILLPAVIIHGSFDFFILWIDFLGKLNGEEVTEGDLEMTNTTEILSVVSCVVVMLAGVVYFSIAANDQRERLAALDRETVVDRSNLI